MKYHDDKDTLNFGFLRPRHFKNYMNDLYTLKTIAQLIGLIHPQKKIHIKSSKYLCITAIDITFEDFKGKNWRSTVTMIE